MLLVVVIIQLEPETPLIYKVIMERLEALYVMHRLVKGSKAADDANCKGSACPSLSISLSTDAAMTR